MEIISQVREHAQINTGAEIASLAGGVLFRGMNLDRGPFQRGTAKEGRLAVQ